MWVHQKRDTISLQGRNSILSDDRQREFARDNSRIIQSMPGSWTSSNPERIGPLHLFHSYVDFTYSKIYGQICQTTDIETWRENVRLLSFNTAILHNTNDQTFLSVELQQNNDELSISNFFFIWKFWKLNMSNFQLITGHPNNWLENIPQRFTVSINMLLRPSRGGNVQMPSHFYHLARARS